MLMTRRRAVKDAAQWLQLYLHAQVSLLIVFMANSKRVFPSSIFKNRGSLQRIPNWMRGASRGVIICQLSLLSSVWECRMPLLLLLLLDALNRLELVIGMSFQWGGIKIDEKSRATIEELQFIEKRWLLWMERLPAHLLTLPEHSNLDESFMSWWGSHWLTDWLSGKGIK